jgi:hypothetical protein
LAKPLNIDEVEWINAITSYVFIYKITQGKFDIIAIAKASIFTTCVSSDYYCLSFTHEPIMKKMASLMLLEVLILLHFHFEWGYMSIIHMAYFNLC